MAVIKSAASAASPQGGCAGSRLDHGSKFYVIQGGCASSRLISGFSDCEHQLPGMYMGKHRQWLQLVGSLLRRALHGVRESVNKSAASAASLDYVKFQAVIKSAASEASLRGGRASGRLDHGFFFRNCWPR